MDGGGVERTLSCERACPPLLRCRKEPSRCPADSDQLSGRLRSERVGSRGGWEGGQPPSAVFRTIAGVSGGVWVPWLQFSTQLRRKRVPGLPARLGGDFSMIGTSDAPKKRDVRRVDT